MRKRQGFEQITGRWNLREVERGLGETVMINGLMRGRRGRMGQIYRNFSLMACQGGYREILGFVLLDRAWFFVR